MAKMPGHRTRTDNLIKLKKMNVVSIMAHQDDEMRCLGTMLKCRARGDQLHFITLTDGSGGFVGRPQLTREKAAGIRHTEMTALADGIGAKLINLRERDEFLYDTADLRLKLIEAIRRTGADLVFTHYYRDYNEDHVTTHRLVRHCCMQAALDLLPMESPFLKAHPAIFCVEPHMPIPFPVTHFVDITEYESEKVRLLQLHESQEEAMRMACGTGFEKICEQPGAYWGEKAGCEYAEAFVSMRARGAIKPFAVLP